MARKPAHLQVAGKLTPRERIWKEIRALREFGYADVADRIYPQEGGRVVEDTIETYVRSLIKAGIVVQTVQHGRRTKARFRLERDLGLEAPRVNKQGELVAMGDKRTAMWRTMKIIKTFTERELAANASTEQRAVSEEDAHTYTQYLRKAGYLMVSKPGRPRSLTVYRFNPGRDTGPRAPMIQRVKAVFDPNLGEIVWHPSVAELEACA